MRDHAWIEELIVVRALGGLDAADEHELHSEMVEHGGDCAECRRLEEEYSEYEDVAGRLAFAIDPVPVRDGFEDEVVDALGTPLVAMTPRELRLERRRLAPPGLILRPLVAVAAALVLFVAGWAAGALTSGQDVPLLAGARVVAFEGETDATLALAYRPGETGLYLVGSGLDPQPEDTAYELWTFRGDTPVRGACFRPRADGSVFEFVDAEIVPTPLMAVTVEAASCPSAPTTTPILVAQATA